MMRWNQQRWDWLGAGGLVLMCLTGFVGAARGQQPVEADILLKGGRIVDGTGAPVRKGDVAIRGDRIVAVGEFAVERVDWIIDCRGLMIAPGFIDLHTHCDGPIQRAETRANVNYLTQGCTTVVTGNCGSGPVDVEAFYATIETYGAGTNVAHLIPQGAVRGHVIGSKQRAATDAEIEKMQELVGRGMRAGAWGMS
ncbi:MAG TPA: D-aminoacylase, partial [Planctomycetaceae bacterium]|nr:D-aminoacylase [Planctomycetaceae bacterium]